MRKRCRKQQGKGLGRKLPWKNSTRRATFLIGAVGKRNPGWSHDFDARANVSGFLTPILSSSHTLSHCMERSARNAAEPYQKKRNKGNVKHTSSSSTISTKKPDNLRSRNTEEPRQIFPRPALALGLLKRIYKINTNRPDTRNSGISLCLDGTSI
ncbi:hypothetical protein BJY01DRAFT_61676 [Aspergillus pseudoustus]|uniref:Uncharacterized protein n=1 Tax=Aspergillus pseudoustus TaxID=1810923 RepID=A0ABR4J967_9EURO